MDLEKLFKLSYDVKDLNSLIIAIVIYVVVPLVFGIVTAIISISIIAWIIGIIGTILGLYCLVGIVLAILQYLKVAKK